MKIQWTKSLDGALLIEQFAKIGFVLNYDDFYLDAENNLVVNCQIDEKSLLNIYEAHSAEAYQQGVKDKKAAARQAILDRLGLTADEAALLLGAK
jgi:hypothetical protein